MRIFAKGMVADTLTLTAGGTDALKVEYKFNANLHWAEVAKLRLDIARLIEDNPKNNEAIGEKCIALFELVFGKICTAQMYSFFESDLESLVLNLAPVFQYKIYPACDKARKRAIKARKKAK